MKRVLVVEDNEMNMELLCQLLEDAEYEPLSAYDGVEGVEVAKAELPDLILMDISMPRMNGLDATVMLKSTPETAHIPVVIVTAHALDSERQRAKETGCDGFLTKPIEEDALTELLEALLS